MHGLPAAASADITALRATLATEASRLLVDGVWEPARSGRTFSVEDPATGAVIAQAAAGDEEDIDRAVAAARRALRDGAWPRLPGSRRAGLLFALADELERHASGLALLESLDAGHALRSIERGDLPLGLRALRDNAGWATKLSGETAVPAADQDGIGYYLRGAVGVVGLITPWNAPFLMVLQKLSAALAAGCTVVIKPSELAPLSAIRIGEACVKVGFPPGVVNVVTGAGAAAGQALAEHRDVDMISFTGSTAVGQSVMAAAARSNLKRVLLELGGKSPVVVFADADLERAAAAIVGEITFKSGQYCAAGTRVFAQAAIHDDLAKRMRALMGEVRIGPGYAPDCDMGPMISEGQRRRATEIIGHSLNAGAQAICGGGPRHGAGYFFAPTILTRASPEMRIMREEIFAPALVTTAFPDDMALAEVARLANDTVFGLSAKVWTRDIGRAHGMAARLEAGQVIVNGGGGEAVLPFGGVKQSGQGRENGRLGVEAYTEIKAVRLGF